MSSGRVELVQVSGAPDPGSPRILELSGGLLLAGTHCVTIAGCVQGTVYQLIIEGCDLYPNCHTYVANPGLTCDFSAPGASSINWTSYSYFGSASVTINWTNTEDLGSGVVRLVRIGGSPDSADHSVTLTGAELAAGPQSWNVSGLVDGCQYNLVFEPCDLAGNCGSTTVYGLTCDLSKPVFSSISLVDGQTYNTTTLPVTFTVSEPLSSGSVDLIWLSGNPDTDKTYTLTGSELFGGTEYINLGSCKPGATYMLVFHACDKVPHCADPVTITNLVCLDNQPPDFLNVSPGSGGFFTSLSGTVSWFNTELLTTLNVTLKWVGGTPDSDHVASCSGPCLGAGDQSLSFPGLVDGATYDIIVDGCDLAPNCHSVTITGLGCDDNSAPVFNVLSPLSGAGFSSTSLNVAWNVSEGLSSGQIRLECEGGASDPGCPHVYSFSGGDLSQGGHNYNFTGLVDGAFYRLVIEGCDLFPHCCVPVTIAGLHCDLSDPVVQILNPASNGVFTTTTIGVDWTTNEDLENCSVILERIGGLADSGAPYTHNCSGLELLAGSHSWFFPGCVEGAVYRLRIQACDHVSHCVQDERTYLRVDLTDPDFEPISPPASSSFAPSSVTVSWLNSEDLGSLSITLLWTGGVSDPASHYHICGGLELISGAQSWTFGGCVPGAIYKVIVAGCDLAPHCVTLEHTGILCLPLTPTVTVTATPSQTPSASMTATPSPTASPSASPSPTGTVTATPTSSPSSSPTASPSWTATSTLTFTPTITATVTLTRSTTFSPTRTPSFSPSPSNTATPSPTWTVTASPTSSPSWTPTVTATITNTIPASLTFTPTCDSDPPGVTVKAVLDPENTDLIRINVTSDEPITTCQGVYIVLRPHSAPKAPVTLTTFGYNAGGFCEAQYNRNMGFGDVDTITAYVRDACGNWGASDGNFERQILNSRCVNIIHNRIDPVSRGDEVLIQYRLSRPQTVKVQVFNKLGEKVRTLVDQFMSSGSFEARWDGRDVFGRVVASDIYIVTVESEECSAQEKILVLK